MKTLFILICPVLLISPGCADSVAGLPDTETVPVDEVKQMCAVLNEGDIASFSEYITSRDLKIPTIYSKWYVDKMPSGTPEERERKERELANRELGRLLLEKMNALAADRVATRKAQSAEDRENTTRLLLQLLSILDKSTGYGNHFLTRRCQDLVNCELAYLAGDINYPMEKVKALMDAYITPQCHTRPYKIQVLKQEGVFDRSALSADPAKVWVSGRRKLYEWCQKNPGYQKSFFERDKVPEELKKFVDDPHIPLRKRTSMGYWEQKYHERVTQDTRLYSGEKLSALIEFREKVGYFPDTSKMPYEGENFFGSIGKAAFEYAWRPYVDHYNYRALYASAWQAYDEVMRYEFYDEETSYKKQAEKEEELLKKQDEENHK